MKFVFTTLCSLNTILLWKAKCKNIALGFCSNFFYLSGFQIFLVISFPPKKVVCKNSQAVHLIFHNKLTFKINMVQETSYIWTLYKQSNCDISYQNGVSSLQSDSKHYRLYAYIKYLYSREFTLRAKQELKDGQKMPRPLINPTHCICCHS